MASRARSWRSGRRARTSAASFSRAPGRGSSSANSSHGLTLLQALLLPTAPGLLQAPPRASGSWSGRPQPSRPPRSAPGRPPRPMAAWPASSPRRAKPWPSAWAGPRATGCSCSGPRWQTRGPCMQLCSGTPEMFTMSGSVLAWSAPARTLRSPRAPASTSSSCLSASWRCRGTTRGSGSEPCCPGRCATCGSGCRRGATARASRRCSHRSPWSPPSKPWGSRP
mmetsp:Transcript_98981/g.317421  ORF Transcript_98981/g.317421 Transcript_98981/m.317421 type:complete len:224 (-) Transcript_98981:500-1171(-)